MKFDCSCIIPECYADTNLVQTLLQMRGANQELITILSKLIMYWMRYLQNRDARDKEKILN